LAQNQGKENQSLNMLVSKKKKEKYKISHFASATTSMMCVGFQKKGALLK
jgi:hypothetical protein